VASSTLSPVSSAASSTLSPVSLTVFSAPGAMLVLSGLLAAAGETEAAKRQVASLKAGTPGLSLENARLPQFGNPSAGERFRALLRDAGL